MLLLDPEIEQSIIQTSLDVPKISFIASSPKAGCDQELCVAVGYPVSLK